MGNLAGHPGSTSKAPRQHGGVSRQHGGALGKLGGDLRQSGGVLRQHGGACRKYVEGIPATRRSIAEVWRSSPATRQGRAAMQRTVDPVRPDIDSVRDRVTGVNNTLPQA